MVKPRKPKEGRSLADLRPDLIEFWSDKNEYSPWDVGIGSICKVYWKCPRGIHEDYEARPNNRCRKVGCKPCSSLDSSERQSLPPYKKSLGFLYPNLAKEWSSKNSKTPFEVYPGSNIKVYWKCTRGIHEDYESTCAHRTSNTPTGCPACWEERRGRTLSIPQPLQSFGDLYPDLVKEWSKENNITPFDIKRGVDYKAIWTCSTCGYEWKATVYSRSKLKSGCPKCSREKVKKALSLPLPNSSFGDLYPSLLKEYSTKNSRNPYSLKPGANYRAKWVCKECGWEWTTSICSRTNTRNPSGCKLCGRIESGKKRSRPKTGSSFGDLYPELAKEWSKENDRDPYEIKPHATYRAKWICSQGHKWEAWVYNRTGVSQTGCPECVNWGTSTAEQNLRSSLLSHGALPTIHKIGLWNVDIYFPETQTVLEYDGSYFHNSEESYERDRRKSLELLAAGYRVIRVRTWGNKFKLESLGIEDENYYEVSCKEPKNSTPSKFLIKELINIVANF